MRGLSEKSESRKKNLMKKIVVLSVLSLGLLGINQSQANILFSDNFNSYPNGNLTNGTTWFQTAAAANPVQVNSGSVVLGTSGQDVYSPLTTPTTLSDGQSIYFSLVIDVTSAQASGDYFLHFTPNPGNSSLFYSRLFIKSVTGGFELGWLGTSGGTGLPTYGTTVLSLGTPYQVVMAYNFSATTPTNSTGAVFVNPTDPNIGNNTAYLTANWLTTTTPDTNSIAAVNLRQGSAGSAAALTVDNLVVATSFSDVVTVPEPSTIALAGLGGLAGLAALRRKR
jgi:hypothetical protein